MKSNLARCKPDGWHVEARDGYIYLYLSPIEAIEKNLNKGRFKKFKKEITDCNEVEITCGHLLSEVFTWVGENIVDAWTMFYDFSDFRTIYYFGFKSEVDAMYFALRWK